MKNKIIIIALGIMLFFGVSNCYASSFGELYHFSVIDYPNTGGSDINYFKMNNTDLEFLHNDEINSKVTQGKNFFLVTDFIESYPSSNKNTLSLYVYIVNDDSSNLCVYKNSINYIMSFFNSIDSAKFATCTLYTFYYEFLNSELNKNDYNSFSKNIIELLDKKIVSPSINRNTWGDNFYNNRYFLSNLSVINKTTKEVIIPSKNLPPFDPTKFILNKTFEPGKVIFNVDIGNQNKNYDIYYNFNSVGDFKKVGNLENFSFSEKNVGEQYLYISIREKNSDYSVYTYTYEFYFDYSNNTDGTYPSKFLKIDKFYEPGKMIISNTILNSNLNYKLKFKITNKETTKINEIKYFDWVYVPFNSKIILTSQEDCPVEFTFCLEDSKGNNQFCKNGSGYLRVNSGGGYYPGSSEDLENGLNPNDPIGSLKNFFNTCKGIFDAIIDMINILPVWITAPLSLFFLLFVIIGVKKLIFG